MRSMQLTRWCEKDGFVHQKWNSPLFGVPLWALSAALLVRWYFHIPPPGYAIGALAVVAGIMSVREMKVLGKISWVVLLGFLLTTEFRAIDSDRAQNARELIEQRKEQDAKFQSILETQNKDFQVTAQSIEDVYSQNQQHFGSTMSGISREVNTYTGGDSFAVFTYVPSQGFLFFIHKGDYPLFSVVARINDLDGPNHGLPGTYVQVGDMIRGHGSTLPTPEFIRTADPARETMNFNIFFTARNGDWTELFRVRRDSAGNLARAVIVEGAFSTMKKAAVVAKPSTKISPWKL